MQKERFFKRFGLLLSLIWTPIVFSAVHTPPLTLPEAEQLALTYSPELQKLQASQKTLEEQAVAEGQLPDPKLMAGALNVPTRTFKFDQEDMTMLEVGLEQSFPPGLKPRQKQLKALAVAEGRKIQEQKAVLLRNVRETWLELYYATRAIEIVEGNKVLYEELLRVTESQYSVAQNSQLSVFQAQLELSRLLDYSKQIQEQIDALRATLARFIGEEEAKRPLAHFPTWEVPPSFSTLQSALQRHPLLAIDAAQIQAAEEDIIFAQAQRWPGWALGVGYGFRQGSMGDGGNRSDMVSARLTLDLPIFPENRQGRRQNAASHQLASAKLEQKTHYLDLTKELAVQYARWERLSERERLYQTRLMLEAKQNSKAALRAYQSATIDLNVVLRAYGNEREINLEQLEVQVLRAKARVALLYLAEVSL